MADGTIYFLGCTETMRVKIGFTKGSPWARLSSLQTGSPTELRVIATMPGNMDSERDLHEKFAASRIRGEWFEMTKELFEHLAIVTWMTAAECRDCGKAPPAWLASALEGTGSADAFPMFAGRTLQ